MKKFTKGMTSLLMSAAVMTSMLPPAAHAADFSYSSTGSDIKRNADNGWNVYWSENIYGAKDADGTSASASYGGAWGVWGQNETYALKIHTKVPNGIRTKDCWGVANKLTFAHWDYFGSHPDANYLHTSIDIALSELKSAEEDAYVTITSKLKSASGEEKEINLFSFYRPTWIKLAGVFQKYEYNPERWMRLDFVFDKKNSTVDAYINGTRFIKGKALDIDINGDSAGFTGLILYTNDSKTESITENTSSTGFREFDLYVRSFGYDYTAEPYHVMNPMELAKDSNGEFSLTLNGGTARTDNEKGIIYGGVDTTANDILSSIGQTGLPSNAAYSVIKEDVTGTGDWIGRNAVEGDTSIEPQLNEGGIYELTENWLKIDVPGDTPSLRKGRVYYIPILDAAVGKIHSGDYLCDDGYYYPGEELKIDILSNADGGNVKVLVAQYDNDNRLDNVICSDITTVLREPQAVRYTPGNDLGKVVIYLWIDDMLPLDRAAELSPAPL
ncbi:MAG: hypothetical protein J6N52_10840 [Clostridia bacterium]|nr:hypothetical protein [Clostridia bacterium]